MKKVLISTGSILIMAFVVVLFINASKNNTIKVKTEVSTEVTASPCPAACSHSAEVAAAPCDPAACKEMKDGNTEGKCDPATCNAHKETRPSETKMYSSASPCKTICPAAAAESK